MKSSVLAWAILTSISTSVFATELPLCEDFYRDDIAVRVHGDRFYKVTGRDIAAWDVPTAKPLYSQQLERDMGHNPQRDILGINTLGEILFAAGTWNSGYESEVSSHNP